MKKTLTEIQDQLIDVLQFCTQNEHASFYRGLPAIDAKNLGASFQTLPTHSLSDYMDLDPYTLLHYPEEDTRFLLTSFEPEKEQFTLYPQHIEAQWQNVVDVCHQTNAHAVGLMTPFFWQLSPMAFQSCKQAKVPFVSMCTLNYPLLEQVMREAEVDVIITTEPILKSLLAEAEDLDAICKRTKAWIIIAPLGMTDVTVDIPGLVIVEYHVFPGVPVAHAEYNAQQQTRGEVIFADKYYVEYGGTDMPKYITSLQSDPLPLIRYQLPDNNL